MKRTFTYLAILTIAIFAAAILFKQQSSKTITDGSTQFSIKDTASITNIYIRNEKGFYTTLSRTAPGYWRVNNLFRARIDAVNHLLNTIRRLEVMYPVPNSQKESVMAAFKKPSKSVDIYADDLSKPIMSYDLSSLTHDNKGTYMKKKGAESAFAVTVPGHDGHLLTRFVALPAEWRDKTVFNYSEDKIAKIRVEYPQTPEHSFELSRLEGDAQFEVNPLDEKTIVPPDAEINRPFTVQYLNNFKGKYLEAYENDHSQIDSIRASKPVCKFMVELVDGKQKEIRVHHLKVNKRSKAQIRADGSPIKYDRDRYLCFVNKGQDLALIQDFVFGPLFKSYNDFIFVRPKE